MSGLSDSDRGRELELLERAAGWAEDVPLEKLTAERLRRIAASEGTDFATAWLYDRVIRSSRHGSFCARIDELRGARDVPSRRSNARFVVVPGAFHRAYPHIDAGGRMLRQVAAEFGCETELIPLPDTGGLEGNARMVLDALLARRDEPVILASLSKGGADVKLALAAPEAEAAFAHVVAWVNVCGMVNGTPLVEWLLARRMRTALVRGLFWWRGFDFQLVRDLHAGPGRLLDRPLRLPRHLRLINVVGFPLAAHLTNRRSRMWHRVLAPFGPNDGGVLLHDVCRLPGRIYPVWGADHYLTPGTTDVRGLTRALLCLLSEEIESSVPAGGFEPLLAASAEAST
ncbi:MAG: hypothetical protein WD066_16175 [Planctomycetaceae bacterium]